MSRAYEALSYLVFQNPPTVDPFNVGLFLLLYLLFVTSSIDIQTTIFMLEGKLK